MQSAGRHGHSRSVANIPNFAPVDRSNPAGSRPVSYHEGFQNGSDRYGSISEETSEETGNDTGYDSGFKFPQSPVFSKFSGVSLGNVDENHSHHERSHSTFKPHTHDHDHDHDHDHHDHHGHDHGHSKPAEPRSRFTKLLIKTTPNWPLLQSVLLEKDSRRIFYFMSLNFAFMLIQAFYGFATDSLGLLSDSIHMFFDCIALALGLFASVASKWPPSQRFPYGFGKIESLSGFGNGIFLMLISIEIVMEAIERLAEGHETKRLTELFIVSSMGLAVNLVGMAAFGHHHHGHDHGHSHGHSHDDHAHSHSHGEKHDHAHDHHDDCDHDHGHAHKGHMHSPSIAGADARALLAETKKHDHSHSHSHGHSHDNENMRGIFLHVLADTMGSAAVIVSTVLIHFLGWPGWDPLASCLIAILIFLSSIPLVSSCARRLLLTLPADTEYSLRETLRGVSDLRGVASYSVPRFWMDDAEGEAQGGVLGAMHVICTRGSDLDDVRERTRQYLRKKGCDVVVQTEREGEGRCWCGGDLRRDGSSIKSF
jgi:zinc transporter 5/7